MVVGVMGVVGMATRAGGILESIVAHGIGLCVHRGRGRRVVVENGVDSHSALTRSWGLHAGQKQ